MSLSFFFRNEWSFSFDNKPLLNLWFIIRLPFWSFHELLCLVALFLPNLQLIQTIFLYRILLDACNWLLNVVLLFMILNWCQMEPTSMTVQQNLFFRFLLWISGQFWMMFKSKHSCSLNFESLISWPLHISLRGRWSIVLLRVITLYC